MNLSVKYIDENTAVFDGCTFKREQSGVHKDYFRCRRKYEKYNGEALHRAVFKAYFGKAIPPEMEVHHKDGNRLNNEIANLIILTCSDHIKIHNIQDPTRVIHACASAARMNKLLGYSNSKAGVEASRKKGWPGARASAEKTSIPVLAYSADGILLGQFQSINAAASSLGISETSISNCLHGRYANVKGVQFKPEVSGK